MRCDPLSPFFSLSLCLSSTRNRINLSIVLSLALSFSLSLFQILLHTGPVVRVRARSAGKKKQYGLTLPRNRVVENARFRVKVGVPDRARHVGWSAC